jgi:hypothetical protein
MAIYLKQEVVMTYPAYDIVEREHCWKHPEAINITEDCLLATRESNFLRHYKAGSVMTYAIQNGECPVAAYNSTTEKMEKDPYSGHKVYWVNQLSSMLTAEKQERKVYVAVEVGMKVRFLGKIFEITAENNHNLGLEEVE